MHHTTAENSIKTSGNIEMAKTWGWDRILSHSLPERQYEQKSLLAKDLYN